MGRGKLTEQEIELLLSNQYVLDVSNDRILFSDEFKKHFMEQYLAENAALQAKLKELTQKA